MPDYNIMLILGGSILLAGVGIPEVFLQGIVIKLLTVFIGYTIVLLGIQKVAQSIIATSSDPPVLVFANSWFITAFIIGSYFIITFFLVRKIITSYRSIEAS